MLFVGFATLTAPALLPAPVTATVTRQTVVRLVVTLVPAALLIAARVQIPAQVPSTSFCVKSMKGWAIAADTGPSQEPSKKRPRATNKGVKAENLLTNIGRCLLSTTAVVRQVRGATIRTFLFLNEDLYTTAATAAGKAYAQLPAGKKPAPPYVYVAAALLLALSTDEQASPEARASAVKFCADKQSPASLLPYITVCRASRCYDKAHTRIELAVAPLHVMEMVFQYLTVTFVQHGAAELFGPAPRGPLERAIAQELDAMRNN